MHHLHYVTFIIPSQKNRISSRAIWGVRSASTMEEIVCARYMLPCAASCPCLRETTGDAVTMGFSCQLMRQLLCALQETKNKAEIQPQIVELVNKEEHKK